jgi:hypothetical protein
VADQYVSAVEGINLGVATNLVTLCVEMTASNRRFVLNELSVSFNGVSSAALPVIVRLVRVTVAPVGGGTITQAPTPMDPAAPASLCTAYCPTFASPGVYATTAPTVGVILRTWYISPTSGFTIQFPLGQEPAVPPTAANGLGIQCLAQAVVAVDQYMVHSE